MIVAQQVTEESGMNQASKRVKKKRKRKERERGKANDENEDDVGIVTRKDETTKTSG